MTKLKTKAASSGTWNSANTDGFRSASAKTVKSATKSREAARAYLVKLGTHKKGGGLTERYKG
ncbi:MAG: hypothetical protein ACK4Z4_17920 [Ferrovibrio sp.]